MFFLFFRVLKLSHSDWEIISIYDLCNVNYNYTRVKHSFSDKTIMYKCIGTIWTWMIISEYRKMVCYVLVLISRTFCSVVTGPASQHCDSAGDSGGLQYGQDFYCHGLRRAWLEKSYGDDARKETSFSTRYDYDFRAILPRL